MPRTTTNIVSDILHNQYDGSKDLSTLIGVANRLVSRVMACAAKKGVTIDSETAADMEAYLAAHLYSFGDQMMQSKSTMSASATFTGQTGMNLDSTYFGQFAKMLDESGCLSAMANQKRVQMSWLGKNTQNVDDNFKTPDEET